MIGRARTLRSGRRSAGVSLIEAVVALGVMAFGMLGLAGIQSTLRSTSDIARQRSEAVRIGQEAIERARAYSSFGPWAGKLDYATLTSGTVSITGTNAIYERTITVTPPVLKSKTVVVDVAWTDRTNTPQSVRLTTAIHGTPPELAAALAIPGSGTATQLPGGRHPGIPPGAVDVGDGTSRFEPTGVSMTVSWIFNNASGLITSRCVGATCTTLTARLLSGFIRFSTGATAPTPADAENPLSTALSAAVVSVNQTLPSTGVGTPECIVVPLTPSPGLAYFCLIEVLAAADPNLRWSGQSLIGGLTLASSVADATASKYRVCRYTPYRSNAAVGAVVPSVVPTATMQNSDHPLSYSLVDGPLTNHNFLVIRAGDGTTAFDCPADNAATPLINGNTFHHQPAA